MPTNEPTLEQVLRTVASEASLDRPAGTLGVSPHRLSELITEAADALQWRIPAKAARSVSPPPAQPLVQPAAKPREPAPPATGRWTRLTLYSDGAARGNPGPAGAGAVLKTPDGQIVERLGKFLGRQTNNVAEYEGVLLGLKRALDLGVREIVVRADSLLAISQLRGEWKIKNEGLRPLFDEARALLRRFDRVTLQHVPREQNTDADEMSNRAIDERM